MDTLTERIGFMGDWLVGVSHALDRGYQCWVIPPERQVHTDGEYYESHLMALAAGRYLVEYSLEVE